MASTGHHRNRKSMADELSKEMNQLLENTFEMKNSKHKRKNHSSNNNSKTSKSKRNNIKSKSNYRTSLNSTIDNNNYNYNNYNNNHNHNNRNKNKIKNIDDINNNNEYIYISNTEYPYFNDNNNHGSELLYYDNNNQILNNNKDINNNSKNYLEHYEEGDFSFISSNYYPYSNIPVNPEDEFYRDDDNINNNNNNINNSNNFVNRNNENYINNTDNFVNNDMYIIDERPSRPQSRWSEDFNFNDNLRSHSLDSQRNTIKSNHKKHRNRSYSPRPSSSYSDNMPLQNKRNSLSIPDFDNLYNKNKESRGSISDADSFYRNQSSGSLRSSAPLINKKKNRKTTLCNSSSIFDNIPQNNLPYTSTNFDELQQLNSIDNNNNNIYINGNNTNSNTNKNTDYFQLENQNTDSYHNNNTNPNDQYYKNDYNNYGNNENYCSFDNNYALSYNNDDNQMSDQIFDSFSMPITSPNDVMPSNSQFQNLNENGKINQNHKFNYSENGDITSCYQGNNFYQDDLHNQELTFKNNNKSNNSHSQQRIKREKHQSKHDNYSNYKKLEEGYSNSSSSNIRRKRSLIKPERSKRRNKYMNYVIKNPNYVILEHDYEDDNEPIPVYPDVYNNNNNNNNSNNNNNNNNINYSINNNNYNNNYYNSSYNDNSTINYDEIDNQKIKIENEKLKRQSNIFAKKNAIDPDFGMSQNDDDSYRSFEKLIKYNWWTIISNACTCYIPNTLLERCNKTDLDVQRAWREKVTLCTIVFCICFISGFFTFGINDILCNETTKIHFSDATFSVHGVAYDIYIKNFNETRRFHSIISASKNHDMGQYFNEIDPESPCQKVLGYNYSINSCSSKIIEKSLTVEHREDKTCYKMKDLLNNSEIDVRKLGDVYYNWDDLERLRDEKNRQLVVYDGNVLDITDYLSGGISSYGNKFTNAIRDKAGQDITYTMSKSRKFKDPIKCMNEIYKVGTIGKSTSGCITSNIILVLTFIFVIGVIFIKFCMALVFNWFLKWKMGDRFGYIKRIADEERRMNKFHEMEDFIHGNANKKKRHVLRDSISISSLLNNKNMTDTIKPNNRINIFNERNRRYSTGQIHGLKYEYNRNNNNNNNSGNNTDDKKSVLKQQNRKSMTSRFSIPQPGEGSRSNICNSAINTQFPNYPSPFTIDGISSTASLKDLTRPKRNSISSWDPLVVSENINNNNMNNTMNNSNNTNKRKSIFSSVIDLTKQRRNSISSFEQLLSSQNYNNSNSIKRKSIFSNASTPSLDTLFKNTQKRTSGLFINTNLPLNNDYTVKSLPDSTLPEPTLPNVDILDNEIDSPTSTNLATSKRMSMALSVINDKRASTLINSSNINSNNNNNHNTNNNIIPEEDIEDASKPLTATSTINDLLNTILLVTCYSEGYEGISSTLDSLSETDYPDSLKLIIVICDGLVKGEGNDKLTPDIVVDMIDPGDGSNYHEDEPDPKSYVAIAEGKKRHNMAKIYPGWYRNALTSFHRKVPMIGIVKCGNESERFGPDKSPKPGNRGKRDSQILLLEFLSRVMSNDRMTEFDFDLFTKIHELTGKYADEYESIMMVDADTVVDKDSLAHLVACLINDPKIMGLCGETQIANKTESWVTMIQVFEYYISHHMSKAFESVFGGVTCLPGCFCMYRIKVRKGTHGYWLPVIANPEIVEQYSENKVDTLHKKNLLLLGEDRYLSTLMLKEFPKRKMVFVPQATCQTIVPSDFKVLLSQRRRWINSTVHNLLELVLVNDLCGTFCFSMQFVVLMELIGTVVLPAAVFFTYYLIGSLIFSGSKNIVAFLLMILVMGLPAILISLTSREMKYILWMFVYLLALPVWNLILPLYSFWHFDDFSWGQTRLVEGEIGNKKKSDHDSNGEFDSSAIIMKKWEEWEKLRIAEILANENYFHLTEKDEGDMGNYSTFYNENQPSEVTNNYNYDYDYSDNNIMNNNNNNNFNNNNNNKRFTGSFNNITLNNRNSSYYQE